jgi:cephalosporin hydroxylase
VCSGERRPRIATVLEKRIDEPRIHVHRGDQSDQSFLHDLARRHGPFDIVIDDGSHVNAHIRASFEALFVDHLKPGGYYIVEDIHCLPGRVRRRSTWAPRNLCGTRPVPGGRPEPAALGRRLRPTGPLAARL